MGLNREAMEALRKYSGGVGYSLGEPSPPVHHAAVRQGGGEVEQEEGEWVEMVSEAGEDEIEDHRPFKALLPGDKGRPVPSALAAGYSHLVVLARFEVRAVCVCCVWYMRVKTIYTPGNRPLFLGNRPLFSGWM